jgi:hypothetical protein
LYVVGSGGLDGGGEEFGGGCGAGWESGEWEWEWEGEESVRALRNGRI